MKRTQSDEQSDGLKSRIARVLMETLLAATSVIAGVLRLNDETRNCNSSKTRGRMSPEVTVGV